MIKLTVKVIGKEIKTEKTTFISYSVMSANENWYRTSKIEPKELAKFVGKVATLTVSRKFDKEYMKKGSIDVYTFPTLVVEEIQEPTEQELREFTEALDKINNATLRDVN